MFTLSVYWWMSTELEYTRLPGDPRETRQGFKMHGTEYHWHRQIRARQAGRMERSDRAGIPWEDSFALQLGVGHGLD